MSLQTSRTASFRVVSTFSACGRYSVEPGTSLRCSHWDTRPAARPAVPPRVSPSHHHPHMKHTDTSVTLVELASLSFGNRVFCPQEGRKNEHTGGCVLIFDVSHSLIQRWRVWGT